MTKGMKKSAVIIAAVTAACVLIVAIVAAALLSRGGNTYDKYLELAQQYMDELDYEQAIAQLRLAIEIEPNNTAAYLALADVYAETGDYGKALAVLEEGYAATGDEAIQDRIASLQEEQSAYEQTEREKRVEEFFVKYEDLCEKVMEKLGAGVPEDVLTMAEREAAYRDIVNELEQYIADLYATEGLPGVLFDEQLAATGNSYNMSTPYFSINSAYKLLARMYLKYLGDLEQCLRVRTEWAEYCGRPELAQDGNHGYDDLHWLDETYDKYGRVTRRESDTSIDTYEYGDEYVGPLYWHGERYLEDHSYSVHEDEYTYDGEGRRIKDVQIQTNSSWNGETRIHVFDYSYTGNSSYIETHKTMVGSIDAEPEYVSERELFYDQYGIIYTSDGNAWGAM